MPSVYALRDPRTGKIRYIGIASEVTRRYKQHIKHTNDYNALKIAWIEDLKSSGMEPLLTILEDDVDSDVILERETYWIQRYLASGEPLTNARTSQKSSAMLTLRNDKKLLTSAEAAEYLSGKAGREINVNRLAQLRRAGKVKAIRLGYNETVYTVEDLEQADVSLSKVGRKKEESKQ